MTEIEAERAAPSQDKSIDRPAAEPEPALSWHNEWFPTVRAPRIVTLWLIRLRWFAVFGQIAATGVARFLHLSAPVIPVAIVTGVTLLSSGVLWRFSRGRALTTGLIFSVLLLDMAMLTVLLVYTGGPANPFSTLYLIQVAMAVTILSSGWTAIVALVAAGLYGSLFFIHCTPLSAGGILQPGIDEVGRVINFVLISGLIAYFSERLHRSLRRRDARIYALRERNERNERLSTLTTLAAGAAHELGTPLATIAVAAHELELAIRKLDAPGDLIEDAQLIRQECNRCRFILDRMRVDVASDTSDARTPLEELFARLAEHLRNDERERLRIVGPQDGVAIAAPCPAVEQSLTVMVRNAFDADASGKPVRLVVRRLRSSVAFDVIDQGTGMPDDVLKRAGEPFFTTKAAGSGMGLGLFLVRLVAENYRGTFTLSSRPNEGTKSTLEFPIA